MKNVVFRFFSVLKRLIKEAWEEYDEDENISFFTHLLHSYIAFKDELDKKEK